jgi:superfamily II DNA or RNA helicase
MSLLTFQIDKSDSIASETLTLVSSLQLSLQQMDKLTRGKEAVKFLHRQELSYRKLLRSGSDQSSFHIFHVQHSDSIEALKLLASAGMLQFNGRSLACDFFGRTTLYYIIDTAPSGAASISAWLKTSIQEFALSECEFICAGPPHWYIKGITLRLIETDIAWKALKKSYETPEQLTVKELQISYGDFDDPSLPQLIFKGEASQLKKEKAAAPMPLLVLSDRLGAFADLWMTYTISSSSSQRVNFYDLQNAIPISGSKDAVRRDIAAEKQWEQDLLETDYTRKAVGGTHYYCPVDRIPKSLTFLLEIGWQIEDSQGRQICRQTNSDISVDSQPQAFLVKGKFHYGDHVADIKDVLGAFNRRERFVQLGSGAIGLLPETTSIEGLADLGEEGEIVQDGIRIDRSRFGSLALTFEKDDSISCDAAFRDLKEKLLSFNGLENSPPGPNFCGTLRPYQQVGVDWLAFLYTHHFHGLLADDMGLGKTVQVLAFLSQLEPCDPILIVLPTSLLFNWKREIERFLPSMNLIVHHGSDRIKTFDHLPLQCIILTSYTTLRIDLPLFERRRYECIILDEAQVIKNAQTQIAQTIYKLKGKFRLSLSGTPVENHLGEMWAQYRFLMPTLFDSEQQFLSDVASGSHDPRHLQKIRRKIAPFFLRRRKEEVAKDLPDRIEQVVWIEMEPQQRQIYEDYLAGFRGNLFKKVEVDGLSKHRMEVLEAILRLRQICCHPLLALPQGEQGVMQSAKLDMLMQDIETVVEEGAKVLVYSQFTSMLKLISKELQSKGWKYAYLDGSSRDREKIVQQFQEDPSTQLFLISLKAGGIGLNLTAADYVFIFDPWWNEAAENQAIDRAHRIGRHSTVIARRYVTTESIEEKIMKLKAAKRGLIESIVDDELGQLSIGIDDLRFLIMDS